MTSSDRWQTLLAKHALSPALVSEDEALFLSLPHTKREGVIERLQALDGYLSLSEPTAAKANEWAAKLGVSQRTFYHLLGKLKTLGPVKGLALGFRVQRRPSVARDGLGGIAEESLAVIFASDPEVRAGVAYRAVTHACEQAGLEPPKETEVRFRLHELRRLHRSTSADAKVGTSILVDQSYINLAARTHKGELTQVMVTLIVDRGTKLILGHGISVEEQDATALESALYNAAHKRLPELAEAELEFVPAPDAVEFIVPPGFEGLDTVWQEEVASALPGTKVVVNDVGPLRHGFALVRLLGDKLGIYNFRTRPRRQDNNLADMIEHDLADCLRIVGYCVDAWNRPILSSLPPSRKQPRSSDDAAKLSKSLNLLFDAFLKQVEMRFPQAAMYRKVPSFEGLD